MWPSPWRRTPEIAGLAFNTFLDRPESQAEQTRAALAGVVRESGSGAVLQPHAGGLKLIARLP